MSLPLETVNRIVELGVDALGPVVNADGDKSFIVLPSETKVEDVSGYFPPKIIKRNVSLIDADSFADYVNRYKTDATLLFAAVSDTGCTLKAILDYHGAAPKLEPGRCDHVASYATNPTPEWRIWMEHDRKKMNQVTFATWLEDNQTFFAEPTGADLLELIGTLHGKSDVRFTSAVRLQSGGNKLHFDEDVELKGQITTKGGDIELPKVVTAGIIPFQGAIHYKVQARLKYRIESRKLELWYETIGVHIIVRDCVKAVVAHVAEKTGIVPLLGDPK